MYALLSLSLTVMPNGKLDRMDDVTLLALLYESVSHCTPCVSLATYLTTALMATDRPMIPKAKLRNSAPARANFMGASDMEVRGRSSVHDIFGCW